MSLWAGGATCGATAVWAAKTSVWGQTHRGTQCPGGGALGVGLLGGAGSKEPTCQCRRRKKHGFDPWVRKTP